MLNKIILVTALVLSLSACTTTESQQQSERIPKIGMPNPASKFCIDQGGQLEIRDQKDGQVGYCILKDGQEIEEWEFFRASVKVCQAEKAQALVGKSHLTDAQISQETEAKTIRRVEPGQPVTMDYREDRITITVDPKTQKITQANCG